MTTATKPTVLLADDQVPTRQMLKSSLSLSGFRVIGEANNGDRAVAKYQQLKPDIALLDIVMPGSTGLYALKKIKSDFPNSVVIMLTSVADEAMMKECLSAGADECLRKDVPIKQIKSRIGEIWAKVEKKRKYPFLSAPSNS